MRYLFLSTITLLSVLFFTSCTNDSGTVTVNYQEATALYGNMDDIRSLPLNATGQSIQNSGKIFISSDFVLIGEEGQGIHVMNNQDRSNPTSEAFIQIPGNKEFYVEGQFLYAESYYDLLKIDISDPYNAVLKDRAKYAIQNEFKNENGETLIGFSYENKTITLDEDDDFMNEIIGDQLVYLDFANNVIPNSSVPSSFTGNSTESIGSINRITISNDHVYVVSNNNMIILDDHNFGNSITRIENIKEEMETVFPFEDKLFVGSKTSMSIFDISNSSHPNEIYDFEHARSCDPVFPHKNVAYVTLRTADFSQCPGNKNVLLVVDINDLSNPTQVAEIQLPSPYGMSVIQDLLFVGNGLNGLVVFDISDAQNPKLVKEYKDLEAYDIIADPNDSNYLFIAGANGMNQYHLRNDLSLELTSSIDY